MGDTERDRGAAATNATSLLPVTYPPSPPFRLKELEVIECCLVFNFEIRNPKIRNPPPISHPRSPRLPIAHFLLFHIPIQRFLKTHVVIARMLATTTVLIGSRNSPPSDSFTVINIASSTRKRSLPSGR